MSHTESSDCCFDEQCTNGANAPNIPSTVKPCPLSSAESSARCPAGKVPLIKGPTSDAVTLVVGPGAVCVKIPMGVAVKQSQFLEAAISERHNGGHQRTIISLPYKWSTTVSNYVAILQGKGCDLDDDLLGDEEWEDDDMDSIQPFSSFEKIVDLLHLSEYLRTTSYKILDVVEDQITTFAALPNRPTLSDEVIDAFLELNYHRYDYTELWDILVSLMLPSIVAARLYDRMDARIRYPSRPVSPFERLLGLEHPLVQALEEDLVSLGDWARPSGVIPVTWLISDAYGRASCVMEDSEKFRQQGSYRTPIHDCITYIPSKLVCRWWR